MKKVRRVKREGREDDWEVFLLEGVDGGGSGRGWNGMVGCIYDVG